MKISINTINGLNTRYKTVSEKLDLDVSKLAEKIGSQLGAVEEVIQVGEKYKGIVIAKVMSCDNHPDADRLHVCLIDDGGVAKGVARNDKGLVQVVCGAPNVRVGLSVAWLPPGVTVPETVDKQPFVLAAKELRGVVSSGMLASPKELAIGDMHDGILEIDGDHQPGEDFAIAFDLSGDAVIDIENKMFTHRPDCFGFLGVAREIAGIFHAKYLSPDWYRLAPAAPAIKGDPLPLKIVNEVPELVKRFCAITMNSVEIKPSPLWLQIELAKVGLRPINNIVDITNFLMLETGQPLHAYDYDKVKTLSSGDTATIVIRKPNKNEKLKLLNGKEIEPNDEAILIASDKQAIGLGGIMGGADAEVDSSTKNIILECANFDMYSIRRTAMEHGLFSDAATRFTKGQSPLPNPAVTLKAAELVTKLAGGQVASQLIDDNHLTPEIISRGSMFPPVTLAPEFINTRLGLKLTGEQIKQLLENVEFKVKTSNSNLVVSSPFWRTDIELPEDVVEEVGRLYGYDELPLTLPKRNLIPADRNALMTAKTAIRGRLSSMGANELLTYSFVHGDLFTKIGQDKTKAYEVGNALRPELQYYRISLVPSLLEKVHPNIKAGYSDFAVFELAKVHDIDSLESDGLPKEYEYTGLVVAKDNKLKVGSSAYYLAKQYLSLLCGVALEFKPLSDSAKSFPVSKPYEPKRTAMVYIKNSGEFLGLVGEFNASVKRTLKLPKYCAGFEVDTTVLAKVIGSNNYVALPRFPKATQDISLKVGASVNYQAAVDVAQAALDQTKPNNSVFDVEPIDIYQGEDKDHKNVTLRLNIASYERTFTDAEVSTLLDHVADEAKAKLQAERL